MPGTGHEQDEPKSSDKRKFTVLNEGEDNVGKVLECIYQHTDAKDAHHNAWFDMLCDKIALPMSKADIEALKALLRTKGNLTLEDIRVIKETLESSLDVERIMTEGKAASTDSTHGGSRKELQRILNNANSIIRLDHMGKNEFNTYSKLFSIGANYLKLLLDDDGTIPEGIDPDDDGNYDTFGDMTPAQQASLIIASYKAAGVHLKNGFNKRLSSDQRLQRNSDGGWLILSDLLLKAKATPAAQVVASVANCLRRPAHGTPLVAAYNAFKSAFAKLINENPGWQHTFGAGAEKLIEMLAEQIFKDHALKLHPELTETIADLGAVGLSEVSIAHTYHVLTQASKLRKAAGNTAKMFASITGQDDEDDDPHESYYGNGHGGESKNNAWQKVGGKESKRNSRTGDNDHNRRNSRTGDNEYDRANNKNTSMARIIQRYSTILDDIVDSGDATKYTEKEAHIQASKDAGIYKVYDFRRFVKHGYQSKQWSKKAMDAKWKRAPRDSGGGDHGGASKDAMDTLRAEMKSEIAAMTKSSDDKFEQLIKAINGQ